MYNKNIIDTHRVYNEARDSFIEDPSILINLEKYISEALRKVISGFIDDAAKDYDAASVLYPFWKNYPPDNRGRRPKGNQYPWIEVGEHTIGVKLARDISRSFDISDVGFPTGADQRFVVASQNILDITDGLTDSSWVCVDIKSAGPTDAAEHAVMSPNQISGSGEWDGIYDGVRNMTVCAMGERRSHDFHPTLPPLIITPEGKVAPTLTYVVKPSYALNYSDCWGGQPLSKLELVSIPNGILMSINPNYIEEYPGLLFPGKDEKSKNLLKLRARVSFRMLNKIDSWRCELIWDRLSGCGD